MIYRNFICSFMNAKGAVRSLLTSHTLLYFGIVLIFFVDYWNGYEVGRLRTAVATFRKEHFVERGKFALSELVVNFQIYG